MKSGPDLWTWIATLDGTERKLALVAGCAVAFVFFRLLDRSRPESQSIQSQLAFSEEEPEEEEVAQQRPTQRPIRRTAPAPRPAPAISVAEGIGLPIGAPAPEFELPGLNGEKRSLRSLLEQGRDVLLVFSSPFCKPCQALTPHLVRWIREIEEPPNVILVSRGTPQDNAGKLKDFEASRVLLQRNFEVAEAYDCTSTPAAVLVGAERLDPKRTRRGRPDIKQLLASSAKKPVSP